mgnify:CR=1 FL=1
MIWTVELTTCLKMTRGELNCLLPLKTISRAKIPLRKKINFSFLLMEFEAWVTIQFGVYLRVQLKQFLLLLVSLIQSWVKIQILQLIFWSWISTTLDKSWQFWLLFINTCSGYGKNLEESISIWVIARVRHHSQNDVSNFHNITQISESIGKLRIFVWTVQKSGNKNSNNIVLVSVWMSSSPV